MLHIPIVHAHDVSKQIPREKKFGGWKCYKTIGSYVSCAFNEIWSTWEVWRALKKLDLPLAMPRATLTHLSCSPNFLHSSYLDERTLMYESIVNWIMASILIIVYKLKSFFISYHQMCRSECHSFSTDIWSIMCLLYQLLAGRPPWVDSCHGSLIYRVNFTMFVILLVHMILPSVLIIAVCNICIAYKPPNDLAYYRVSVAHW